MSKLDNDIREEYDKHRSLFKTAKRLSVSIDYVLSVVESQVIEEKPDTSTCHWEGFGDPDKKRYLVARNLAKNSWDNGRPEVADARAKFEAGTHTLAIGRDGPWLLMYVFPLAVPKPRPNYFQPTVEA